MSFLPPAPRSGPAVELPEPPPTEPNVYLKADDPSVLAATTAAPSIPRRKSEADITIQNAERAYQRGRRLYQSRDLDGARREFDRAIDGMLDAGGQDPSDRVEIERKLEEMADAIHRYDLEDFGAGASVDQPKFEKAPLEDILQMTFPVDPKLKDRVQAQVAATVSQLPLSVNDTVLGYINYFSNRGRRTLLAGLQRSGRYRPMIQRVLDEEGVPQELIHLAQAESGFFPRAMSRAAAGGMWQFLKWRGNEYGLKQTAFTDDRMDPEMATRAAAKHLHDLYREFGDWYLAIAAYNCGPLVVEKAVERTGYADFWELRARGVLPAETTNYVPIILAMTIMEKNAAEYGIEGFQMDAPLEYDTVETRGVTSLALVSDILDVPVTELAEMNPSSLRGKVPEGYPMHVPKGTADQLMAVVQRIPANHLDAWRVHSVLAGETLAEIGRRYSVTAANIAAVNQLENEQPQEGDRLLIPAAPRAEPPARKATRSGSRTVTASRRGPVPSRGASTRRTATSAARTRTTRPSAIVARNTN
ncbi:MAG: transglycosylase SLT domain-containing protein [Acidobacteria bacterium]|nr:transglycosylase SLT domain-containing protein [Acidobacteriota bacterium]